MKNIWNKYKREFVVLLATLVMAVVFTVLNSNFLNYNNFVTILQQMVLNGVLAVGMMFTIITGGIDLSVGSKLWNESIPWNFSRTCSWCSSWCI